MTETSLDPRFHAFRPDLADVALRGRVEAARYVDGHRARFVRTAPLRAAPSMLGQLMTEALGGELTKVFEVAGGWAWVQLDRDGYVGYVPADALTQSIAFATHVVTAPVALVFSQADLKSPPIGRRFLGEELSVTASAEGDYVPVPSGGFAHRKTLAPVGYLAVDFVSVAERFMGVPYLWGGKTALGLDCSGLVQLTMQMSGLTCPRDTDVQRTGVGTSVKEMALPDALQRGDLVFWNGHVGMMIDAEILLHANAFHMEVAREPLREAISRIAADTGPVLDVRRP